MSLIADDFAEFVSSDTDGGGDDRPLGDTLSELAMNVDDDAEGQ